MDMTPNTTFDSDIPVATRFLLRHENLPNPWVHYPGGFHDGPQCFIAFSKQEQDIPLLCECAQEAVKNAILQHGEGHEAGGVRFWRSASFLGRFPITLRAIFPTSEYRSDRSDREDPFWNDAEGWFQHYRFGPALCHRCNLAVPTVRYRKTGGKFDQFYGWYIQQARYRLGAFKLDVFANRCPPEILDIWRKDDELEPEWSRLLKLAGEADATHGVENEHPERMTSWEAFKLIDRERTRLHREWQKIPENLARQEYGFADVGEHWVSESMLLSVVRRLLRLDKEQEIIRRHRPIWLEGLELDIHIPAINLALEYNGQQHYYAIEAWGGEAALEKQIRNDERKAAICLERGINLVVIKYTEPLNEMHIRQRIKETPWYEAGGWKHI